MLSLLLAVSLSAAPAQEVTVRAGGTEVTTHCAGVRAAGAPLVLLESGAGNGLDVWARVQPAIAAFARVCAYDRPTLMPNVTPPRASFVPGAVVETLHGVAHALGEPPYVMVGHSYGGMIVRLYDTTYPGETSGLVLVDSAHEDQIARFKAIDPSTTQGIGMNPHEALDLAAFSEALHAHRWSPTVSYVVLTRAPLAVAPTPVNAAFDGVWRELQHELATRSTHGRQIVAAHAGHYIQREEPDLVIDAVRSVVGGASQLRCTPTPEVPIVAAVGAGRGSNPVWLIEAGASPRNEPSKVMWVFHTRERVRVEGHAQATGRPTRFQLGGGHTPILEAIVIDDPHRVTVTPGGASAELMEEYSFVPSYVYFPQPGCFEFTIQLERATRHIVIEVK